MTDASAMWAFIAFVGVVVAVVCYVAWQQRHDHEQWKREHERRDLLSEIQHVLRVHETALLARCSELDRKLAKQERVLAFIARRLS